MAATKGITLSEYQSSVEFKQVYEGQYDEVIQAFMYNVWRAHPEWDLSFLGQAAREMVTYFNEPPETPINDAPTEFVPFTDQSPQVADQPPQVINEDSPTVNASGGGGADKDDEVVQINNPVGIMSFEDHPPGNLN